MKASVGSSVGVPGTCCPLVLVLAMVEPDDLGSRGSRWAYRSVDERGEGGRVDVAELEGEKEKVEGSCRGEGRGTGTPEAARALEGRRALGGSCGRRLDVCSRSCSSDDEYGVGAASPMLSSPNAGSGNASSGNDSVVGVGPSRESCARRLRSCSALSATSKGGGCHAPPCSKGVNGPCAGVSPCALIDETDSSSRSRSTKSE